MVRQRTELTVGGKSNTIVSALVKTSVGWADLFERVTLKAGNRITHQGMRPSFVYFPIDAVVSELVTPEGPKKTTDDMLVSMLGGEDVVGVQALLDAAPSPTTGFVEIGGSALRCSAQAGRRFAEEHPDGREILQAYLVLAQTESLQWLSFSLQRSVTDRLTAYLYWMREVSKEDMLPVTHRGISKKTGIRRPSLTEKAMPALVQAGLVEQVSDGRIDIKAPHRMGELMLEIWPLFGQHRQAFRDALAIS